jgi:cation-transporting ATPase I
VSVLSAVLVGPGRLVGAAYSLPRRVLDLVDRDRVAGRRASLRGDRAMIEVRGVGRPDGARFGARLVHTLEELPGVRWTGLNAPLGRVIVTLEHSGAPPLAELVAVVDQVERDYRAGTAEGDRPSAGDGSRRAAPSPTDRGGVDQALWALTATAAGLVLSGVGAAARFTPLPAELAALATVVDNQPRLRGLLETVLGRPATDLGLAVLSASGQGLAGGRVGLGVDAAYRVGALGEARAAHAAWRAQEGELLADPQRAAAEPVVIERPQPLPPGPVETYADQATLAGLGAFGVALPATGNPRRAVNLALATVPKAARLGREGFATGLGRLLARRGAVVLDATVLRRLDRVDTVVLDAEVLVTGQLVLGEVLPLAGADPSQVAGQLYAMFRASDATAIRRRDEWVLGPVGELAVRERRAVREQQRLLRAGAAHVLGLAHGSELVAVAGVVAEPSESVEALAAASHRAGTRLVLAGTTPGVSTALADTVLPGGGRLLGTVRWLQAQGAVVLLVSRHRSALGNADIGVGVSGLDGRPAWGAPVLVGNDLELAALLIEACGPARQISHRGVSLSQAGSVLGGIGALTGSGWGFGSGPAQAAMLGVNGAAAVAFAQGTWAAREVGRRPLDPPISRIPWHAMPVEAVLDQLTTTPAGLSTAEVTRRRRRARQPELARPSLARAVVEELDNPLTPILAGGAALSAAVGSVTDAALVAGVSALSALVGGVQRLRTDRAVAALLANSAVIARVLRDDQPVSRPAEELVAGDVVELRSGDVVPADCRVLDAAALQVDESALTGEPFPVSKHSAPTVAATVADRTSMLYEGTSVAAGRGSAIVVATGASTEAGRSMAATHAASPPTGVETRLAAITNTTLPIALGSAGAVIAAGLLWGRPLRESLGAGVSLAVASVPEGLPFLVNAAQLAAARRLSAHGALVRNPRTIEALGRVDTLCFDKTGTLTEGRITLAAVAEATADPVPLDRLGDPQRRTLAAGLRATPLRRGGQPLAHLTDQAVATGADSAAIARDHDLPGWRQLAALPFEPSRGYHATLASAAETALLSVKGAPEIVLPRCARLHSNGEEIPLDTPARNRLHHRVEHLTGQGYRVLAVAERCAHPRHQLDDDEVACLTLLGFLALTDPVRPAAAASVTELRNAGIQIVMITGDHPGTAQAIAERLDVLDGGQMMTGPELDTLDDDALDELLPQVTVVARSTPAHKVRVVQAFQRLQRTVAMTGDGANDAPAIRLADVGIALGRRATPAARAAADLVVTDDRLETILAALVEGRGMWASVRQALGILVGGNLGEIAFTVLGAALTGRSPLNTRQLLLVNLLTDLAPAMAIALRPPDSGSTAALLAEGPEASLGTALTRDITNRALTTATAATAAWTAARLTGRATRARTIALAALVGTQLGQTLAIGGPSPAVLASSLGSAAALAGIIQTPGLSHFFGCTPLGPLGWTIAGGAATAATATTLLLPPLLAHLREQPLPGEPAPCPPSPSVHLTVTPLPAQPRLINTQKP